MKRFFSFFTSLLLILSLIRITFADDPIYREISEEEAYVWATAIESTAPDASFAARVAIASVLLNRFRSELFPASPVKIVKNAEFLSLDLSVTPSHKSLSAVRFALLGASPCGRALHAKKAEKGEGDNPILSVDGWLFYD
jgi:hypothetical protein